MNIKHHKILIPNSVKNALQKQVEYIAFDQKNPAEALKWLDGIIDAIQSLEKFPERCAIALENYYIKSGQEILVRHLIYKKSFRVIFTIVKNEVRILSVRHSRRRT